MASSLNCSKGGPIRHRRAHVSFQKGRNQENNSLWGHRNTIFLKKHQTSGKHVGDTGAPYSAKNIKKQTKKTHSLHGDTGAPYFSTNVTNPSNIYI